MLDSDLQNRLLALVDWYRQMGADTAVGEIATDWTARPSALPGAGFAWPEAAARDRQTASAAAAPVVEARSSSVPIRQPLAAPNAAPRPPTLRPTAPQIRPVAPTSATPRPNDSQRGARVAANSLEDLRAELARFDGCGLKATAKNLCFYRGAAKARVMIIGEAPGREEDLEGKPFVGRAGQLLDKMLTAIGLGEETVHITNIVYWRPPGNRTPTAQEALACRPFLEKQIELVGPELLVLLGGAAAKEMLATTDGIMRLRGKWRDLSIAGQTIKTLATLHPAYLLRAPAAKAMAWRDLLSLKAAL